MAAPVSIQGSPSPEEVAYKLLYLVAWGENKDLEGWGKADRKWVANADWQSWVREMEKTALAIRAAVKSQDQKKLAAAADHLQQTCESCHTKYRPQTASDGVSRYPFYPKRELAK